MAATQYAIAKRIESQPNCKRMYDPKLKGLHVLTIKSLFLVSTLSRRQNSKIQVIATQ